MATIDIHNLSGAKVGTLDLADEVFGAVNEDLLWEAVKHYRAAQRAGTHATKNKKLVSGCGQEALEAEGHRTGARRLDPFPTVAAWRHGSWTATPLLRLHFPAQEAAGRVALGAGCEVGRRQIDRGERVRHEGAEDQSVPRGAGHAEGRKARCWWSKLPQQDNRNLDLSSRNIAGLELVRGNEVHPYHLLRYDVAIFSQPAIEKLQVSLKDRFRNAAQAGRRRRRSQRS